jgi:hypothetical protein
MGEVTGIQFPAESGLDFLSIASRKVLGTPSRLSINHQEAIPQL